MSILLTLIDVNAKPAPSKSHFQSRSNSYLPRLDFGAYKLNGSNANSAGVIESFVPFYQRPNFITFSNFRYYTQSGSPWEGNIALGLRRLNKHNQIFGIYGSFDRSRSQSRQYFSQATIGFELWFNRLFLGGNGYIIIHPKDYPANAFNAASLSPSSTSGLFNILYFNGSERALPGVDALLGYDFTDRLTIYGGAYYFHKKNLPTVSGPKLRATYTFYSHPGFRMFGVFDRIQLEGQVTHDNVRQTDWYVGIRFGINLGRNRHKLTRLQQHMVDMIRRDENIIDVEYTEVQSNVLKNADGSAVTVALPDSYSAFAVATEGATGADIVGVNGTLTASPGDQQSLNIIRDLQINGGTYSFSVAGRPYSVVVGNQGEVSVDNSLNYFLNIQNTSNVNLDQMTFENKSGQVLRTENTSSGILSINKTIFKGVSNVSNALVSLNGNGNVQLNDLTFNFDASSTGPGLSLSGSGGLVTVNGTINSNLNAQDVYLISMQGAENLTISNATLTNNGQGGLLDIELSTTGRVSILNSTFQSNGTTPLITFEDTENPILDNVTVINTNTTNTAPLIKIASTAKITLNTSELTLINSGLGQSIDDEGDLTIINSTITETTGDPVIEIQNGTTGIVYVLNSTITNLGSGCIFRVGMSAQAGITVINSTLVGNGATATMMLGSNDSNSSTTLTNVNLSNTGSGSLIEHSGSAPLTLNTFIGLAQTGTGDGISLSSTDTINPHTLTLTNITLQGNLSGNLIDLPSGSTESLVVGDNVIITNAGLGNLIYHEGVGNVTFTPGATITLSHTGSGIAGNGIVFANSDVLTPKTFTLSNITINGNMDGELITVPSNGTTSVVIENNSSLTNSGNGGVLTMLASNANANLTISNSNLENNGTGDLLTLAGGGQVNINNGAAFNGTSNSNLISVEGATGNISIVGTVLTPITFSTNGFAIITNGASFGNMVVEYANSNAPFDFKLSNASAQGQITFNNNTLTIGNGTAIDSSVLNNFASVIFSLNDNSQSLTVSSLSNNTIGITRTDTLDTYGFYAAGISSKPVEFTNGIINNTVTLNNSSSTGAASTTKLVGFYNSNMTLQANFSNNQFTILGRAGNTLTGAQGAIGMYSTNNFVIGNNASMTNNNFQATNSLSNGDSAGWYAGGPVVISGNFGGNMVSLGNTFISQNTAANGYGFWSDSTVSVTGSIGYNTFNASSNGATSYGWRSDANVTVNNGDINNNTFIASSNGGNNSFGWQARGAINLSNGNFSDNSFTANSNGQDGYAFETRSSFAVNVNMQNNTFNAQSNSRNGFGWQSDNVVNIGGDFINNTFTASLNDENDLRSGRGYGWQLRNAVTITGNFGGAAANLGNNFTVEQNGDDGIGLHMTSSNVSLTVNGSYFGYNVFTSNNNIDNGFGWQTTGDIIITGEFSNNTFNLSNNRRNRALDINDNFTLDGLFTNNQFTVTSTSNRICRGLDIDMRGSEITQFKQAVTGNTFSIVTGNTNSFAFRLDTRNSGGIYFQGNPTEADLKAVNGNATVNNYGTDNVNFGIGP